MKYKWIIILGLVAALGCMKSNVDVEEDYITLRYNQTQCADPWRYAPTDAEQQLAIKNYLDSIRLYAATVSISADSIGQACAACTCKTGKVVTVATLDIDSLRIKFQALGFR